MAKFSFTENQDKAIHHSGHNLLVSASAGSGKTRVLVQRVIEKIKAGTSIDQLLIVTFTRAAAKEMRDRIQQALRKELADAEGEPERQQFLLQQLNLLPVADISTLDSFCQRLISRYYYVINRDPVFRLLGDETEQALLQDEVWNDLREQLYTKDQDGTFSALTANFSDDRSDQGLANLVLQVYDFANANPAPAQWLADLPKRYELDGKSLTTSTFYQAEVLPVLQAQLDQMIHDLTSGYQTAATAGLDTRVDYLNAMTSQLVELRESLGDLSWNDLRDRVTTFDWGKIPTSRKKDEAYEAEVRVKTYRDTAKDALNKLGDQYFQFNEGDTVDLMTHAHGLVAKLAEVVSQYIQAYRAEKQRRHVLDFSDLEHDALAIVSGTSDESSQVRQLLTQHYAEIMVDEYQDTNALQEAILTSISQPDPGNLFMVGDVKQSIYRFRQADPTLFVSKYERYGDGTTHNELVTLPDNFRSMRNVDQFTNLVFTQLMNRDLGEVDYSGDNELVFGATYYPDDLPPVAKLLVYESEDDPDSQPDGEPVSETGLIDNKVKGEIVMAARQIQQLIADQTLIYDRQLNEKRLIEYRDITLLTPTKANNLTITDLFQKLGIPVAVNNAQSYFKTTEIQTMMALLSVIDNPYQDIPLTAVLRSPIVGLDENELAALRLVNKTGNYYQAVLDFMDQYPKGDLTIEAQLPSVDWMTLYHKLKRFLGQLHGFKEVAQQNELVALIWKIYQETGFLDYVGGMPAGEQRQANLHALYDRAKAYEQSSFKGLFQFVRFVQKMQGRDKDLAVAETQSATNAVSVMTIHGSKGLEFPVVFLIDASKRFNQQDQRGKYVMTAKQGIGIDYLNPQTRVKAPTLQKQMVTNAIQTASLSEEMRKLYVALTRAEQQIYVVGTHKSQEEALSIWQDADQSDGLVLNATIRAKNANYLDWIGLSLYRHPEFSAQFDGVGDSLAELSEDQTSFSVVFKTKQELELEAVNDDHMGADWLADLTKKTAAAKFEAVDVDRIDQIMDFKYRHQVATATTAYQSVSEAKRLFDDPDNLELGNYQPGSHGHLGNRYVETDFKRPQFLQTVREPLATEIGSATHLVLQSVDLTVPVTADSLHETVTRLVADQVISAEVADRIDEVGILTFFNSSLGQQLLAHPKDVHREVPFSLLMPAKTLFADFDDATSEILIHGIMDGYLVTKDEVILFDYKTDYVDVTQQEAAVDQIVERYSGQVNLYAAALEQILNRPVTKQGLYLLRTGQLVAVPKQKVRL
ncbi:helicase-exonuclease AddAB subunit AddA [Levilactobacillus bambusae]|uniref:ATP-dependent helicase/nuclease subunit A n=1 Tax=Levilactobacillus bambusae TaxID=2024736 RepID=A0A2V1N0G9_9LACO|nr:helicase-exonuclease AddAB subunit AddA [Levilactobacillus bambusae]PWG00562.1 helicase-exonuclease AddAB subunit AddA [Levilactobacillus bambusae]